MYNVHVQLIFVGQLHPIVSKMYVYKYMLWIIIHNKFRSEWCQTRLIDFSVSNYGSKSETKENHNQTGLKSFLIDSKFILNYKIYTINVTLSLKGRLHK